MICPLIVAIVERDQRREISARTVEGLDAARARGVRLGRRPKLDASEVAAVVKSAATGRSAASLARRYGVNRSTISRILKRNRDTAPEIAPGSRLAVYAYQPFPTNSPTGH